MSDLALLDFYLDKLAKQEVLALSLTQPYATLTVLGEKKIETRVWCAAPKFFGPILIHAAQGMPNWAIACCKEEPFASIPLPDGNTIGATNERLPRGGIVGIATLTEIRSTGSEETPAAWIPDKASNEYAFGNYLPRRYGWFLKDPIFLPKPVPMRGQLKLWLPPDDVLEAVARVLKDSR